MFDRTFLLSTETTDLPLVVTAPALDDFRQQGLEAMDGCIHTLCQRLVPAKAPDQNAQPIEIVGQMMLDGLATGNTRKLVLCALWMAHHHPDATGLVCNGEKFHFVYGESTVMTEPQRACA